MNTTHHDVTTHLFEMQGSVVAHPELPAESKLLFCQLMCQYGFRGGWIMADSRWSEDERHSLRELEQAGFVTLTQECGVLIKHAGIRAHEGK